jgi:hypothetical protein
MISKKGLNKVLPLWLEGLNGLLMDCDYDAHACDKKWTQIQVDNEMFTFKRKLGYQRPSFSSTLKVMVYNLD